MAFWGILWQSKDYVPKCCSLRRCFCYVFCPNIIPVYLYFLRKYLISKSYYISCFRNPRSSSWFIIVQFEALSDLIVMHHWRTSTNCLHQLIFGLVWLRHYLIRLKNITLSRELTVFFNVLKKFLLK